jgi:fucose 4-O-acetylase-like acetyltransferase
MFNFCSFNSSFLYWLPFTGLFVAGYVYGRKKFQSISGAYILLTTSLIITVLGAYFYYLFEIQGNNILTARGCLNFYTDSYLSFNVVVMSVAAYIIIMQSKLIDRISRIKLLKNLVFSIARNSLGIFVLHIFFIDVLDRKLNLFTYIAPAWFYLLIKFIVIFVISYLASLVIMRIPYVRKVLGES